MSLNVLGNNRVKTIGLIGGMSWESTRLYYEYLNRGVQQRLGGLHSARVLLSSLDFAPIATMQRESRWDEAGEVLALEAARLEQAGADLIALSTNTMHKCAAQVTAAIRVPFLHIVDPLVDALRTDGRNRPLLLATRFTMEDRFFVERLEAANLKPLVPPADDRIALHTIIFDELCKGIVTAPSKQLAERLVHDGAAIGSDSVILGCTEICMLIRSGTVPLPVYDTTALHTSALVEAAVQHGR
jgi:aspartate racemase